MIGGTSQKISEEEVEKEDEEVEVGEEEEKEDEDEEEKKWGRRWRKKKRPYFYPHSQAHSLYSLQPLRLIQGQPVLPNCTPAISGRDSSPAI